ncbi:MAG: helix-turn-helix transcriptional regulator [Thermoguttaceae bacterium]|jgi:predicted XRE-type DNA-binding protein
MATPTKSQVAEQIRQAIAKSDKSRYQISMETGVDQGQLSKFMRGQNMRIGALEAIAKALGLEIIVRPVRRKKGG